MTKLAFLMALNEKLSRLPREEAEERLRFYSEMIEDRMEEGLAEEDAVAAVGSVDEIATQILSEFPNTTEPKLRKKRMKTWEIVLLAVGSPVWVSLLIAGFAVALSLYISLWAIILSLWAVFVSLSACTLAGIAAGIGFAIAGNVPIGIAMLGAACLCAGLAIALFFVCKIATKYTFRLLKLCTQLLGTRLKRKEA